MDKFATRILDHLKHPSYIPATSDELAEQLRLSSKLKTRHAAALQFLQQKGYVHTGRDGKLHPASGSKSITGIFRRLSSGKGYVIPHGQAKGSNAEIHVTRADARDAHTGDEVVVQLLKRRRSGGQRCGRVESIIERATTTFVGTYFEEGDRAYVLIDGRSFSEPVVVNDPGAKGPAPDDKVVVEMLRFPSPMHFGEAVLVKVLGPLGEPDVDSQTIIHELGLPDEFPEKVLKAARECAQNFDESDLQGRRDLSKETIVTIDPVDARDFDDAISLSKQKNGHWLLGVHIADVSAFIPRGSLLDDEARNRGTSVYLPGRVIPMLPELISNGLASLQKGKIRFTKTAWIEFTADGVPVHTEFENTAIQVTRRFAYEEVMPIIENPDQFKSKVSAKVRTLLLNMHELAMTLRKRRFEAGALELALPEVKVELDRKHRVIGAKEVHHDDSHRIIEEFMLAANIAVAQKLADEEIGFLRRVHGSPRETKLRAFAKFANALGFPIERPQSRAELQSLLDKVAGKPQERAINYALLRSLTQAEYSPLEIPHYALSVANYCHFTSPIRRYPDLTIHRLIDALLTKKRKPRKRGGDLERLGQHCSFTERRAATAERELTRLKLLQFMQEKVGEEFDALITGVERFGLFCQCEEIPAEGMVHIRTLGPHETFDYDADAFCLTGRKSGVRYQLGDRVRVKVAEVDIYRRELDFRIIGKPQQTKSAKRKRQSPANKKSRKTGRKKSKPANRSRRGATKRGKRR